jgi:hypothetical protein
MIEIDVKQTYKSALDSVDLIERYVSGKNVPEFITKEQYNDDIQRNVDYLESLLTKDYWTDEDLTPFENAVKEGHDYLNK